MSTKKPVKQGQRLGGGMVLLPNNDGIVPVHRFALGQPYSLGDKAFYVEPGLVADAVELLNLRRMEDVRQLQFISTVCVGGRIVGGKGPHVFPHNRLIHNLRAGALHGIMGRRCPEYSCQCALCQKDLAIGILADCMHDNFTCAGGDSWKDVNHQGTLFDEDDSFGDKIFRYYGDGWRQLCAKYGFNSQMTAHVTIQNIIEGKGLSGEIHEIADTASYMMGDLEQIRLIEKGFGNAEDFSEILSVAERPWDIWNHVREKDGHIVITDPLALNNFLLLRVLLWKNWYQNPGRKILEMLMMKVVYPYLVSRRLLKIKDLPVNGDTWLFEIVEREMRWANGVSRDLNLFGSFPKLKTFRTWEEALSFEQKKFYSVSANYFTLVFSVEDFQKTSFKTDKYWVVGSDGRVDTFKALYAPHAAVIERIAASCTLSERPVYVMYVKNANISDNLHKAWQEARARWMKQGE